MNLLRPRDQQLLTLPVDVGTGCFPTVSLEPPPFHPQHSVVVRHSVVARFRESIGCITLDHEASFETTSPAKLRRFCPPASDVSVPILNEHQKRMLSSPIRNPSTLVGSIIPVSLTHVRNKTSLFHSRQSEWSLDSRENTRC